ncbi:MAG: glycosyltransferase, partial [Stellaceae bacterium]
MPSVLFHVQYLLGIGHLQRSLRIAEALADAGLAVTLVQGGPPLPEITCGGGIDIVQLPAIRSRDASFALVDAAGELVTDALREQRRTALLCAFNTARPDAVVIEGFPFARRAFRFELDPLIAAARGAGAKIICSVRDIPTVRADPERLAAIVARVRGDFDAVLVHGDPGFIPFDAAFPAAPEIADRLHYTGYVATVSLSTPGGGEGRGEAGDSGSAGAFPRHPPSAKLRAPSPPNGRRGNEDDDILISVGGGGAAGRALMQAAIEARRRGCLPTKTWRILTGTALSDADLAEIRAAAPPGLIVERFRRDFASLLRACHVSVSQAGYNTVLDILAAKARAVLVPFAAERETEQLIRAEHLAARGAAVLLRERELDAASLAAAIERAASSEPA